MNDFTIDSIYHGFLLQKKEYIQEIHSTVYLFKHQLLGTPALAIKNDDHNKTFCIAFQTVPEDSTGVAHILEHSVLMGSKKYPVHDVFGEINKGGLMTFLNAMTGADLTLYPFATRNKTEYFNIMDVYCDVTLNPLLLRSTFEQEGWHYHKESQDAPLQFQGVVFNEMKGAFSDPIRSLFRHTFAGLMPESTYIHESGGDPAVIPDLSYEQFQDFHKHHYHPSNSMLFFYGDADLDEELAAVQNNFLSRYNAAESVSEIKPGRSITSPVVIEDSYGVHPGSDTSGKTFLAVSSSVGTALERKKNTAFHIISHILYNSDASPLKKKIIEAGLCHDFGGLFISDSGFKTFMMTYLIGSDPDKKERFLALYQESLSSMVEQGIDSDLILSELNKYEFSVREESTSSQRGLDLISRAMTALKYGNDPFASLEIEELFAEIRQQALEEGYFEELIKEHLINNPASVTVTLCPDPEKNSKKAKEEEDRLAAYEQSLTAEQLDHLIASTNELIALQQRPNDEQALSLLPRLSRTDLERTPPYLAPLIDHDGSVELLINEVETNSIAHIQIGLDCSTLAPDLLPWLEIFGVIATEIGTGKRDYIRFAKDVNIYTGGISRSFLTYMDRSNNREVRPVLWFQVKTLSSYIAEGVDLVAEIFSILDLENRSRIREIVQREFTWAEHSVQSDGHSLAQNAVFSHLSKAGNINEQVSGVTAYLELKNLAKNYDSLESDFINRLEQLRDSLFHSSGIKVAVTGSADDIDKVRSRIAVITRSLTATAAETQPYTPVNLPRHQAFCTPAEVVFNVQGMSLLPDTSEYSGHFEVVKTWLSRDYLWNSVRQKGGAYGCFIQFNHVTGSIGFISYRDPQIQQTYDAYDAIEPTLAQLNLSQSTLDQLIIGTYGKMNPHQSPASAALVARNEYLSGISPSFKQLLVAEIIDTSVESMRAYAPFFHGMCEKSFRATIGNGDKIREHADLFDTISEL